MNLQLVRNLGPVHANRIFVARIRVDPDLNHLLWRVVSKRCGFRRRADSLVLHERFPTSHRLNNLVLHLVKSLQFSYTSDHSGGISPFRSLQGVSLGGFVILTFVSFFFQIMSCYHLNKASLAEIFGKYCYHLGIGQKRNWDFFHFEILTVADNKIESVKET